MDRLSQRAAFRLDRRLFHQYSRTTIHRVGWTSTRILLTLISLALLALITGCLIGGALLALRDFPGIWIFPGTVLMLVALALRPRFGRPPRPKSRLRRDTAPTLFSLIDQICDALGARVPDIVAVEATYNASVARVGWRRRLVLRIGVPLWITLDAPQRVALLAHELAHDVNGDPNRGLLVQPALTTFSTLADAASGNKAIGNILLDYRPRITVTQLMVELWLWLVSRVFLVIHLGLSAAGARDRQRAEYLADILGCEVAGTAAMASLLDRLVVLPEVTNLIYHNAPSTAPDGWNTLASSVQAHESGTLPLRRQLTLRAATLWESHPPAGYRAMMLGAMTPIRPKVGLSEHDSTAIDRELAGWYGAARRRIVGARDTWL